MEKQLLQPVDIPERVNDSTPVERIHFEDIINKDGFYAEAHIQDTAAQTATNYGIFFIARRPCEVLYVVERHDTAGSDAGAVTLDVLLVPDGTAAGSGTTVLGSTFNLKSTANTNVKKQTTSLATGRQLVEGDALALKSGGTLTALKGVHVSVFLKPLGKGHYL